LNKKIALFFRGKSAGYCVVALLLAIFLSGCATVPKPELPETKMPEAPLKDLCEKYNLVCKWDSLSQVISLKGYSLSAKALIDSNIVLVDEKKLFLNDNIRIKESVILVPGDFYSKVLEVLIKSETKETVYIEKKLPPALLRKEDFIVKKVNHIIIDAGHGGKDPGAIGRSGVQEKGVVLDIAKKLKSALEDKGFRVVLTRSNDEFKTLQERTEITSKSSADLFISIHANASKARSASGVEVYTFGDMTYSDKNEDQRKLNQKLVFRNLEMTKDDNELETIISDMYYSNKQSESEKLARTVIGSISKLVKSKYRGVKEERYFVLRNTLIPAILIEVGFLSNPREEKLLAHKSYRQKIANSIAKGVIEYVHQ